MAMGCGRMGPWGAPFISGMPGMGGMGMLPGMGSPFANIPAPEEKPDAYVPSESNARRRTVMGKLLIGLVGVAVAVITFRSGLGKLFQPKAVKEMAGSLREAKLLKVKDNIAKCEKALEAAERSGSKKELRETRKMVKRYERRLFRDVDTEHLAERLRDLRKVNKSPNSDIGQAFDNMGARLRNNKLVVKAKLPKHVHQLEKTLQKKPEYFGKARGHLEAYCESGEIKHLDALKKHLHGDADILKLGKKQKNHDSLSYLLEQHKNDLSPNAKKYHEVLSAYEKLVPVEIVANGTAPKFYPDRLKAKAGDFIRKTHDGKNPINNNIFTEDPWKKHLWEKHNVSGSKSFDDLGAKMDKIKEETEFWENKYKDLEELSDDALKAKHAELAKTESTLDEATRRLHENLSNKDVNQIRNYQQEKIEHLAQVKKQIPLALDDLMLDQQHTVQQARKARCQSLLDTLLSHNSIH
jgi:hypothetical protein